MESFVEAEREVVLCASAGVESASVVGVKEAEVKTSVVEGVRRVEGECSEGCGDALKTILEAIEDLKMSFASEVNELKSVVMKQEIEIRSLKCGGEGPSRVSGGAHARDVPVGVPERDVTRETTKVTIKSPVIGVWKVVDNGARPKEKKVNNDHVVCTNPFQVLSGLQEGDTEVRKVDDTSLPEGKILVVGDSQVRHLDSRFCDREGMRMKSLSYPGKGIGYVSDKIVECMADQGKKPIVCLSAGEMMLSVLWHHRSRIPPKELEAPNLLPPEHVFQGKHKQEVNVTMTSRWQDGRSNYVYSEPASLERRENKHVVKMPNNVQVAQQLSVAMVSIASSYARKHYSRASGL
ncbi:hypothetical protein GWK47_040320 [Chionoecetes opilio]|uniref:Uncharacterized protein n=1 Tax=Chionoecetes opilio TaxID=41210 RepID=A0A8J4YAT9_CHIOP|nr:hypothetical protein GWK47_040320 [Chionoecetes opilio]